MSGFVKRNSVNTVNPAGGVNPAQAPNVGQYGWTSFDANNVNQIIEYVNLCKEYSERTKEYADYVQGRFGELEAFMDFIETVYEELKPIIDQIQPIYTDIISRHEDIITRHIDVIKLHGEVTATKIEVDQIKDETITEANRIKDETIAESDAIKVQTIAEANVIKGQATAEANRAKLEADRSATEADRSGSSAVDSANSAIASGSEAGKAAASAKEAADIAEELRKGQVYRGTWNIEANKAYPPKPDTNSVWDVVLNEGSVQFAFDGATWYWGDRLLYLKDDNKFSQIESGSGVLSVNGKTGAVTLTAEDVKAVKQAGDTMSGNLEMGAGARLVLNNTAVLGANNAAVIRDHGNGNVTISAGKSTAGVAGELYLGYNGTLSGTEGYNTKNVRLDSPLNWRNTHALVDGSGLLNSEKMFGPIRTEVTPGNVWHTIVGGTDTINRGRTIIAAGESGKVIHENTNPESEGVHIAGDQSDGVYIHTGVQQGWGATPHVRYQFKEGDIYSQKMVGTEINRFYHQGFKPTAVDVGAVRKSGDDGVGSLTLAADKVLNATLTHQRGYLSIYPYGTSYGLGGDSGNRARIYYKEHNNGNPSDISRGLVVNSNNADGTSYPLDMWLNGQKVYHQGNKPTATELGVLALTGGTVTGNLNLTKSLSVEGQIMNSTFTNANKQLLNGGTNQVYVGNRDGVTELHLQTNNGVAFVSEGASNHRIYHQGFKPTLGDIIGADNLTKKTYTIAKPSGLVDGKYYPVLFIGTTNHPDVTISTATASAASSMNNCSFKGQVVSGGWTDQGRYATGNFNIYDEKERAIHSVVGSSESENHFVFYVEARAFPLKVVVDSKVEVSCSGKDAIYGTSTYKAGISGMTTSGDFGTKTSLIQNFDKGQGFYSGTLRSGYISAVGGINATDRVNLVDYNSNGAFITRRPGKPSYSMMGQDSNGNTMLGLGVDTSGYSSYLKVSAATLAYSTNGSTESRIYHEGFKPSLGELGGIASTGGTMTAPLYWVDTNKYINSANNDLYVVAKAGMIILEGKVNPKARVDGVSHTLYHTGNKPSAADVGAVSTSGGTINGKLTIRNSSSHIDLIETDNADKTWRIEGQGNNLDFTESGVATRLRLKAGGGAIISGQLDVSGHVTLGNSSILKLPTANYTTGAQIYVRDGGQYGANFVINTGGNMILGAGECGTAFANEIGSAATEHAYVLADGDVNLMPGANTIADKKTHKFSADGSITFNDGATTARTFYGSSGKTYVSRTGTSLYIAANEDNGRVYIEGKLNPIVRIGSNDYQMYHSGNKPTIDDIAGGKAIGASQLLGSGVDLDDFKTAGVYHQPGNAGATSGLNYPEPLAGSLVVYLAAGIIQEYRIYNTSRMWRRAQYSSGAWTAWTKDYNSGNKPTAAELAVVPVSDVAAGSSFDQLINKIPKHSSSGVLEIGRYLDMHTTGSTRDFDTRLEARPDGSMGVITLVSNKLDIGGGYLRSNTADVASLDGRKYSFVTSPLDAHLCSNAFWDGTNWLKYDASKKSIYAVAKGDAGFTIYGSNATSTSPQEYTLMNITHNGYTSFGGSIETNGDILAQKGITARGSLNAGGYISVTRGVNPMVELHKPGVSAAIMYIEGSNRLRFGQSNGAGGEANEYLTLSHSTAQIPGSIFSQMDADRAWASYGKHVLWSSGGPARPAGVAHGLVGREVRSDSGWALDMGYGMYQAGPSADRAAHAFMATDGVGYTKLWFLYNDGSLQTPDGTWFVERNGTIGGTIFGGYSTMINWCTASFAPASDGNLKTILGESKTSALGKIGKMKFHEFVWKDHTASGQLTKRDTKINPIGVIAQELEEIDASFTRDIETFAEDGSVAESVKTLDTANLLAVALKAIQELQAEVADLKEKLNELV